MILVPQNVTMSKCQSPGTKGKCDLHPKRSTIGKNSTADKPTSGLSQSPLAAGHTDERCGLSGPDYKEPVLTASFNDTTK